MRELQLDPRLAPYAGQGPGRWPVDDHWKVLVIGEHAGLRACVMQFIYTSAVVTIDAGELWSYQDRWCYHSPAAAIAGAAAWDMTSEPEPTGWHRHPATGRRRAGGDPAAEVVAW